MSLICVVFWGGGGDGGGGGLRSPNLMQKMYVNNKNIMHPCSEDSFVKHILDLES